MGGCLVARGFSRAGGGGRTGTRTHDARAPEVRAGRHNLQPANLEPEILGPRVTRRVADSPGHVFLTEELAIDCEALLADGSLPRERRKMSGRGRAGEGATMGGCLVARGFSRAGGGGRAHTRTHDAGARGARRQAQPSTSKP